MQPGRTTEIVSRDPAETQDLGRIIGQIGQPGDVILLAGTLGAGKTCLTQGIAYGLDIHEVTTSPTFVLVREFYGRIPLYHMDLYRLELGEIDELGLDEYLYGEGISAVEWAEKGMRLMPPHHLLVELEYLGQNERRIRLTPSGERPQELLSGIEALWTARKRKR